MGEDQEISTKNKHGGGSKHNRGKGNLLYRKSNTDKSKEAAVAVSAAESSTEELSMDFSAELKHNSETHGNDSITYFTSSGNKQDEEDTETESIYYFGYGPIVNPLVRQRRGFGAEVIPEAQIQPAILYDHRLQFIEGGTANIIPCRGWDVKGILIKFQSVEELHQLHAFDLNYDIHDVSVSLINKTNLDPKNKNDYTAPFEGQAQAENQKQQGHQSEGEGVDRRGATSGNSSNSCPDLDFDYISEGDEDKPDPNDEDEDEDDRDDEANAIHAVTFMNLSHRTASLAASSPCQHRFDTSTTTVAAFSRGSVCSQTSTGSAATNCPLSVVGMPQERYLKLMTDGLRQYEIDEDYINDEIMVVAYVPKEKDAIVVCQENKGKKTKGIATTLITTNYRTFPLVKVKEKEKEPKKYRT